LASDALFEILPLHNLQKKVHTEEIKHPSTKKRVERCNLIKRSVQSCLVSVRPLIVRKLIFLLKREGENLS